MPTPVESILTSVGLPQEDVAKIITLPADDTFDVKPIVEKVKANYSKQLQNDPTFFNDMTIEKLPSEVVKKIESAQFFRANNIMKTKLLKGLGISESELNDLSDEEKEKLELYVQAVANRFAKTKAGDKQLQQDLIEARKKIESFDGLEEKLKQKYESESNTKISSAIFNAVLLGELSSIPGLKISASDVARTATDILTSKYAFERVGDFGIELRQKANPQMKVLKDGSSHELTLKDAIMMIAEDRGWIEKENDDGIKGAGRVKVTPAGGKLKMIAPHIQEKISKKIAAEQ